MLTTFLERDNCIHVCCELMEEYEDLAKLAVEMDERFGSDEHIDVFL